MNKTNIGPVVLGKMPEIAAIVESRSDLAQIPRAEKLGAGLVELRFDLINLPEAEALSLATEVKGMGRFGIIGTLRETQANRGKRVTFFKTVMPALDAVDIEIESGISGEVIALAQGKTVIVSHHDFERTPPMKELQALADRCFSLGGHIAKIAVTARSNKDVDLLEEFTRGYKKPFVSIAMGPLGRDWRVKAFKAGSLFTYAYLGEKPVVPGQLSAEELSHRIAVAFPSFKTKLIRQAQKGRA